MHPSFPAEMVYLLQRAKAKPGPSSLPVRRAEGQHQAFVQLGVLAAAELLGHVVVFQVRRKGPELRGKAPGLSGSVGQRVRRDKARPASRVAGVDRDRALEHRDRLAVIAELEFRIACELEPYRHDRIART